MRVALGAPVAERAWILPQWVDCLRAQTLQPDYLRFVYSPSSDSTLDILLGDLPRLGYDTEAYITKIPYRSRNDRNCDPKDPWSADHMARLRNRLKMLVMATDADVFISLDTDILLEDTTLLEKLVATLSDDWNLVAGNTSLHPLESTCYNVGWFTDSGDGDFDQSWRRADPNDVATHRPPIQIDIPMAFYAAQRFVLGMCSYSPHAQGEDIGFAQSLRRHRFRCGWRTDLQARHVWGPEFWGPE